MPQPTTLKRARKVREHAERFVRLVDGLPDTSQGAQAWSEQEEEALCDAIDAACLLIEDAEVAKAQLQEDKEDCQNQGA